MKKNYFKKLLCSSVKCQLSHVSCSSRGFTIIEMVVSVSIFIVVMVISAGAILSITNANRKAQSAKVAIDNLSFALESMSRHIRVGTNFSCSDDTNDAEECTYADGGGTVFSFKYKDPSHPPEDPPYEIVYKFESGVLKVKTGSGDWDSLTSSDIIIDSSKSKFYVEGTLNGDEKQPRVLIVVKGTAGGVDVKYQTDFNLQTFVTQRALDF